MRPAVFMDRDGTISEEIGYIYDPARFRLLPGAVSAIRRLNEECVPAILASNQSGPARGYYGEETIQAVMAEMHRQLASEGAHLDAVYYCPHLPGGIVPQYAVECECRKPRPGMLLRAADEYRLDLERSFMIGDKRCDIEAAHLAGCRAIFVLTGYGRRLWADQSLWRSVRPDHVALDLGAAVDWLLEAMRRN